LAPTIGVVAVDRLAPVATRGHVVDGAGELDAQRAGHGPSVTSVKAKGKT
jgi:hypothetical protein